MKENIIIALINAGVSLANKLIGKLPNKFFQSPKRTTKKSYRDSNNAPTQHTNQQTVKSSPIQPVNRQETKSSPIKHTDQQISKSSSTSANSNTTKMHLTSPVACQKEGQTHLQSSLKNDDLESTHLQFVTELIKNSPVRDKITTSTIDLEGE